MAAPVQRLLVVKFGPLGDTVLLIPALRALRSALPDAHITWLMSPVNAPLARLVPYVNDLVELPSLRHVDFIRTVLLLRGRKFDAVIDFEQRSWASALLALLSGTPRRVGFERQGQARSRLYTERYWRSFTRHDAHEFLALAGTLTPVIFDPALEVWETEDGKEAVENVGLPRKGDGPLVILDPSCGLHGAGREWSLGNFAVLGHWLIQKHGAELLIASAPGAGLKTRQLARLLNQKARDLGALSSNGLTSLLNRVDLLISGESDAMHLAAALGRPQIALLGPSDPAVRGPLNARARVVLGEGWMAGVSVEGVKAAVEAVFDNAGTI